MSKSSNNPLGKSYPTVTTDGKVTHVMVPIEEYEQLMLSALAEESVRILDDPNTERISSGEAALRLAGNRIATARRKAKLTQKQLAEQIGVTQSEISRIENNPENSTIRTLKRIAKALKVDVRSLIDSGKAA
jgi:DNA-binding XRE family transcriptional regulator